MSAADIGGANPISWRLGVLAVNLCLLALVAGCATGRSAQVVKPFTPAQAYSAPANAAGVDTALTRYLKQLADARGHALSVDPRLEQLASFAAVRGEALPTRLLELAARQLGVYDAQLVLIVRPVPGSLESSQISVALDEGLRAQRYTHLGAAYAQRAGVRQLFVVLAARRVWLEPVPNSLPVGGAIALRGRLAPGYQNARAELLAGGTRAVVPVGAGNALSLQLPAAQPGLHRVEIFADGPHGAECLAKLPVYVGSSFPSGLSVADHEQHYDFGAVAQQVFASINRERARAGLPALARDARLDALAQAHSTDMRDHAFVGHNSVRSGDPLQRVAAAGLPTTLVLETIARGNAPEALEASPKAPAGEFRNLMARNITHAGIGVTAQYDAHGPVLLATELFVELPERIDVATATPRLLALINEARVKRAAPTLVLDPGLSHVASEAARRFVEDASATEQSVLADADRELNRFSLAYRRVNALIVTLPRLTDAAQLEPALEPQAGAIGIGIAQGSRGGTPVLTVVLTLGTLRAHE